MTEPADDEKAVDDEPRRRVRVFRRYDEFGMPGELVEVDADAAGHWDASVWNRDPRSC